MALERRVTDQLGATVGPSPLGSDALFGQDDRSVVAPYRLDAFF
jgi:hypothetical protein